MKRLPVILLSVFLVPVCNEEAKVYAASINGRCIDICIYPGFGPIDKYHCL